MFVQCNPNPRWKRLDDCVVRAIAIAEDREWRGVYRELCEVGDELYMMPSTNACWDKLLTRHGWKKSIAYCPPCLTVAEFAEHNPYGVFLLATGSHVVAVRDGDWLDAWDSGDEVIAYYYTR